MELNLNFYYYVIMFDLFLAQVLILILLFSSGIRVLFIKNPRVDAFAVIPVFAFLISLLLIPIWGITVQNLVIIVLSALFFLTNVRALFRVSSNLIVDNYTLAFIIANFIELLLLIATIAFVVLSAPVRCKLKDFGTQKEKVYLTGTLAAGIRKGDFFEGDAFSGILYIYKPLQEISASEKPAASSAEGTAAGAASAVSTTVADTASAPVSTAPSVPVIQEPAQENTSERPIIVFAGTSVGTVEQYEPYILFLSKNGFTVCAADLYTRDMHIYEGASNRRFARRIRTLYNYVQDKTEFEATKKKELLLSRQKYERLTELVLDLFGESQTVYYITDGVSFDTINAVIEAFPKNAIGFYSLNRIPEYKTQGFGFIQQTDILLAKYFSMKRDSSFFIPRYVANKTKDDILLLLAKIQKQKQSEEKQNAENQTENDQEKGVQ